MKLQNVKNDFKLKVSVSFFLFSSLLVIFYTLIDHSIFSSQIKQIIIENATKKLYEREKYFDDTLNEALYKIKALGNNDMVKNYIRDNSTYKSEVLSLFFSVAEANKNLMQVRFLDKNGIEKIRIDRTSYFQNDVKIINTLQDKSNRDYFKKIKEAHHVYFSTLDLNIEQGKVEVPFKPTYRVGIPLYLKDSFEGMIVLNYFAQPLLDKLFDAPLYDSILMDEDGYILNHYENKFNWSKYQEKSFKIDTNYLDHIGKNFYKSNDFVMKKLSLPLSNKLYLVLKLSKLTQMEHQNVYQKRAITVISLFLLVMLFISVVIYLVFLNLEKKDTQIKLLTKNKKEQESILIQKSKMAAMGEMIANIAHQWRQPLAIISLNTTNLQRKLSKDKLTDEFIEQYIFKVNSTLKNMNQTIEDFSNFFKPNKEKTLFELNTLITDTLELIKKPIIDNEIKITFDEITTYKYFGHRNELQQVLLNIISNSKDAIQINNIKDGFIKIGITQSKDSFTIEILDNAGGIPVNILDRIFEPYFTTKFKSDGTGIGLYMCKMIIEDSFEGSIKLENKGCGALCTIIIPKEKI